MQQLGHADPAFTLRVYAHVMRHSEDARAANARNRASLKHFPCNTGTLQRCAIGQVIAEARILRSIPGDWAHKSAVCPIGWGPDHWSQWMKLSYGEPPKISSSSDFTSGPIDPGP